ncbi:MAG: hypothetical protein J1E63_10900 [Muribaculaceae bacterium]|nr:hypothetical protein [Muribaculaceae bacterium]
MISRYKLYLYPFVTVFWIMSCLGFVDQQLIPPLEKLHNAILAACDLVIIVLGLLTLKQRGDMVVFWSYLIIGAISTLFLNHIGIFNLFNGTRDFLGLIFAVPILRWFMTCEYREEFKRLMDKTLTAWLWLQAFTITWQFIKYGAGDWGGGTMGHGASGMMSMSIYLISFFLIVRRWDSSQYFSSLWKNRMYIFLLYPSFLNETKVSFILLAAYFILLIKFDRHFLVKILYVLPVGVAVFIGLGSLYFSVTKQDPDEVLSVEFFEDYLYGQDLDNIIEVSMMIQDGTMDVDPREWWTVDIPRIAKLVLIAPELRDTEGGLLFGAGLGQFKGGTMSDVPRFARINEWLLNGSRPWIFFIIVQLGWIGYVWFVCLMVRNLWIRRSNYPLAHKVVTLLALAFLIIQFYDASLRSFNFDVLLFYMTLCMQLDSGTKQEAATDAQAYLT